MGNFKHNVEKIKLNLQHDLVAEKIRQHPTAKVAGLLFLSVSLGLLTAVDDDDACTATGQQKRRRLQRGQRND